LRSKKEFFLVVLMNSMHFPFMQVITDKVSTDFTGDGSQARLGIRWFPPLKEQLKHFLAHRCLMDSREFKRCCDW